MCWVCYLYKTIRVLKLRTHPRYKKYAQHILDTGHAYNTMDQTMKILHIEKEGQKLNTLEQFEIYKLTKKALQLNDTHTETHNPILIP
jgi:hypothetical protein